MARSYFKTLWRKLVDGAQTPKEVVGTVEFDYQPLDTPVADVEIDCVRHPTVSVVSTLVVSAPFEDADDEPALVVSAAQIAHSKQAEIETAIARIAGTDPDMVTVDMMVRACTASDGTEDHGGPMAPPKLDVDHPLSAGAEPPHEGGVATREGSAPPARTAGERMAALLASHPGMHLFVSVPVLTPEGLAWLDEQTQETCPPAPQATNGERKDDGHRGGLRWARRTAAVVVWVGVVAVFIWFVWHIFSDIGGTLVGVVSCLAALAVLRPLLANMLWAIKMVYWPATKGANRVEAWLSEMWRRAPNAPESESNGEVDR